MRPSAMRRHLLPAEWVLEKRTTGEDGRRNAYAVLDLLSVGHGDDTHYQPDAEQQREELAARAVGRAVADRPAAWALANHWTCASHLGS
jgi:hypothetical protein